MTIATCPNCGAKNRTNEPAASGRLPICGRCKCQLIPSPTPAPASSPSCIFEKVRYEQVEQNGVKGLLIRADIVAGGMENKDVILAAYFTLGNGEWIKPGSRYVSRDGVACVYRGLHCKYPTSRFTDVELFIPNDELRLSPQFRHPLGFKLQVSTPDTTIGWSNKFDFCVEAAEPFVIFKDVRSELGLRTLGAPEWQKPLGTGFDRRETGLLVHVHFEVKYVWGREINVAAFFSFANGQPLRDVNTLYQSADGQVAVSENVIIPDNEGSGKEWTDFQLFIPDHELHLEQGIQHSCQFVVQVAVKDTKEWKTLGTSNPVGFTFHKPADPPPVVLPSVVAPATTQKQPGFFGWLTGKTCPHCGKRGYQRYIGQTLGDSYVSSRPEQVTDNHFGPRGGFREGFTYRTVYRTVTVQRYHDNYECTNCGGAFHTVSEREI